MKLTSDFTCSACHFTCDLVPSPKMVLFPLCDDYMVYALCYVLSVPARECTLKM